LLRDIQQGVSVAGGPAIVRRIGELRAAVAFWRKAGDSVGLVPTMGSLHEGHLTLVRQAKADGGRAVATLFVNPTQFGANEDLAAYPRDESTDRALLGQARADLLFAPDVDEIYPEGFATTVTVARLTEHLCGSHRPGHFAGVATVVAKLLSQALPDRAYFGEKDFQQLQVIRRMARDLDLPVAIIGVPTVREADGLALSSRNRYLSASERQRAAALAQLLRAAADRLADGRAAAPEIDIVRAGLSAAGFGKIDYVTLADEAELQPLAKARPPCRLFAAAWLGRTRLIDNWPVG
jgi:pantoate--beta-alanine ligase